MVNMVEVEMKYSFPLFTKEKCIVNLGDNEKLVISDIWAFWDYVVKKKTSNLNKKKQEFLFSLLEQSKNFYTAAVNSPTKSQPLLYYYSFLNFSKILINITGDVRESLQYHHGVNNRASANFSTAKVKKLAQAAPGSTIVPVAHELLVLFDGTIPLGETEFNIKDILNHCVGVHRAYSEIYNQKEIFFRLANHKLYRRERDLIFEAEVICKDTDCASLRAHGYNIEKREKNFFYVEKITINHYRPNRKNLAELSKKIKDKGIWYFIGNNGYTIYLSNSATGRYSQESIIYMVMFYLGSITRYYPYKFDELFSDKEQWLMSEFLNTQPKQFIYLATARMLGQSVVKAYASF